MDIKSNQILTKYEIIIDHNSLISLHTVSESIEILNQLAFEANLRNARRLRDKYKEYFLVDLDRVLQYLEENKSEVVWLESVESGSSKFKGVIVNVGALLIVTLVTKIFGDVLDKKSWYSEFINDLNNSSSAIAELIVNDFDKIINPKELPDNMKVEVRIVGDRVRIFVIPGQAKKDVTIFDNPDS